MDLEALRSTHKDILGCEVKDSTGLNDFQKLPNQFGVAIPKVGIERFRIPLTFTHEDNSKMTHDCEASMFVFLSAQKNGVNMSRFCSILQEEAAKESISNSFFNKVLTRFRFDLRDSESEEAIKKSHLKLSFNYPVKQKSLKSENWGWQYYECELEGSQNYEGETVMDLLLKFEYSSTCPCSLSMAKQYEEQYRKGLITEGNGIATAHSQRSIATVKVRYNVESNFTIDRLIELLRVALPTETQSLVKRLDEQAFAILNGENPMFVEHSSRRISTVLNNEDDILDWEAKVEHLESLHSHNAVAYIRK